MVQVVACAQSRSIEPDDVARVIDTNLELHHVTSYNTANRAKLGSIAQAAQIAQFAQFTQSTYNISSCRAWPATPSAPGGGGGVDAGADERMQLAAEVAKQVMALVNPQLLALEAKIAKLPPSLVKAAAALDKVLLRDLRNLRDLRYSCGIRAIIAQFAQLPQFA